MKVDSKINLILNLVIFAILITVLVKLMKKKEGYEAGTCPSGHAKFNHTYVLPRQFSY
jgi:hypothetical protein